MSEFPVFITFFVILLSSLLLLVIQKILHCSLILFEMSNEIDIVTKDDFEHL